MNRKPGIAAWAFGLLAAALLAATAYAGEPPLRVMSFNIRFGLADDGADAWSQRRARVIDVLRAQAPQLVATQEALRFQLDDLHAALPQLAEIGVGRDDGAQGGEYAAILYDRNRLIPLEQGNFWFSDSPERPGSMDWGNRYPRLCTWARFRDIETGRRFYLFNLHWDHESQIARERSAQLLLARIAARAQADEPVLVTGDFNAGPDNPARRRLLAGSAPGLRDSYSHIHPDETAAGTFNGFTGDRSGERIDAILADPAWRVDDAGIEHWHRDGRYPSDHFPVTAVLWLSAAPAR